MLKRAMACAVVALFASRSQAQSVAPGTAQQPAAPAAPAMPTDETGLLTEILKELRALRLEMRTLRQIQANPPRAQVTPPPVPTSMKLGVGSSLGGDKASVAIVEFSDYQCPFCKRHHDQTFSKIKEAYIDSGKVRYEFRDYPLVSIHPQARPGSIAARCAARQGAFWPMHDELFKNQARLGPDAYTELAKTLGLDGDKFKQCLVEPEVGKSLDQDVAAAEQLGVRGTPYFLIGSIRGGNLEGIKALSGAQPLDAFEGILDPLLSGAAVATAIPH